MVKDIQAVEYALRAGGLIPGEIIAGGLQRCKVEGDKGGQRSGAYRLFDDGIPACLWWNWKTSATGIWVSTERPLCAADRYQQRQCIERAKREHAAAQAAQRVSNSKYLTCLWDSAQPLTQACAAGVYLERRRLIVPNTDALRFAPRLDYWHDGLLIGAFPAMLAAVTDAKGALVNVHRTYLSAEGRKADVPIVKKLCKSAGTMAGASIKIGQPVTRPDGRPGLAVAEGIETAIAASILTGVPTWSCVSAHGMEAFSPPLGVRHLYIMGDNDESGTGQKAAAALAVRAASMGLLARVLLPEARGDWADELVSRRAAV